MTMTQYPKLGEKVYTKVLSNGLTVKVVSRPGFTRKMAYFVTDFGAIHTDFELEGKTWHVPAGIGLRPGENLHFPPAPAHRRWRKCPF